VIKINPELSRLELAGSGSELYTNTTENPFSAPGTGRSATITHGGLERRGRIILVLGAEVNLPEHLRLPSHPQPEGRKRLPQLPDRPIAKLGDANDGRPSQYLPG
jgi:hypothetical protein